MPRSAAGLCRPRSEAPRADRREPEHDVQGHGRRRCGLAVAEGAADRTADRSAGERDQPVRPDGRPEGSPLRAVPGDPVASPRHRGLRDPVADRVGAGAGAADDPGIADSDWRQSQAADDRGQVRGEPVVPRVDGRSSRPGR